MTPSPSASMIFMISWRIGDDPMGSWDTQHMTRPGKHTNIAIENGDLVRGFSHEKWWCSIVMLVYQRVPTILHYITISNYPIGLLRPSWKWGCWDVEPSLKAHARLYINFNKYHILGDQHPFRPSILMFTTGNYKAWSHPRRMISSFRIGKNIWIDIILYIYYISLKNGDFTWLSRNHQIYRDSTTTKKCLYSHPKQRFNHPTGLSGWLDSCFAHREAAWKICKVSNWVGELGRKFLHPQICEVG